MVVQRGHRPIPFATATRLLDVSLTELQDLGVRGLIVDLDNTLLAYEASEPPDAHVAWIEDAVARGFAVTIVSNNFSERVSRISRRLNVPGFANALKPLPFAYLRAMRTMKTTSRDTMVIGDQLLTDILGAAGVGVRGVLTRPIASREFPLTRALRYIERIVLGSRMS